MALALECCRRSTDPHANAHDAAGALSFADDAAASLLGAMSDALWVGDARILRARLALALRVLLRVADDDLGPVGWLGTSGHRYEWGDAWPTDDDVRWQRLPVRPLWEQAKPHEVKS